MINPLCAVRAVALSYLLVLLVGARAWGGIEGEKEQPPPTVSPTTEEVRTAPVPPPPLRVVGTVISPQKKAALIVILDERGKERSSLKVNEGETVEGYRIVKIYMDQVSFERGGQTFLVTVWNERPPIPRIVPDLPYEGTKERSAEFVTPPSNVEEIKKGTEVFFEQLGQNPEFQKKLEEMRPLIRQRLETSGANR